MATEHQSFGRNNPSLDPATFVDRRSANPGTSTSGHERRQFSDGRQDLSADAAELGSAIDQYKLLNRRRYISYEEMLSIIQSLGYSKL